MWASLSLSIISLLFPLTPSLSRQIMLDSLSREYRLEIITAKNDFLVKTKWGAIWGREASLGNLDHYVPLLDREMRIYPASLFKAAGVKRIVLCEGLVFDRQLRNAIPDFSSNTYYLEIKRGADNRRYLALVFHHDLFHFIDWRDDGQLYQDERWTSLNPPTFKYGKGGRNSQDQRSTSVLTDRYPGHLNHYSTTGVEEDKAEIFAHLLINSIYVESRITKDAILLRKIERMKEMVKAFCAECGDDLWSKSRKINRER